MLRRARNIAGASRRLGLSKNLLRIRIASMNRLLFGDNLRWLRDKNLFADASVDLEYLDPPFNSNASYNMLFKETSGEDSEAQLHAFTDTWKWTPLVRDTYREFVDTCPNALRLCLPSG